MPAVRFHARTRCARCQAPLPVDGLWTTVPCPACNHNNTVTPETWAILLQAVLDDPEPEVPVSLTRTMAGSTWEIGWRAAKRAPPDARPLPSHTFADDVFDWPRVADEGDPAIPEVTTAIAHRCPSCSAPVEVDGSTRNPTCGACGTSFLLPDAVWARLHPPRDARPFVLVFGESGRKEGFSWFGLHDVAQLPDGELLIAATDEAGSLVARLDRELRPIWRKHGLKAETLRVAATPDGRVLALDPARHALAVLSTADGSALGNLGGKEPEGAALHHLDVHEAVDLCACADGSVLVCVADRFVRYDGTGAGIPTWPPAKGWFSWLFGTEKPVALYGPGRAKNAPPGSGQPGAPRPHAPNPMLHPRFLALPDGGVVMATLMSPVHAYRRDGTLAWTWELPSGSSMPLDHRPALGPDGSVWLVHLDGEGGSVIWRRAPDGSAAQVGRTPHYVTGVVPLSADVAWVLGANGEIWRLEGGAFAARNPSALDRERWHAESGGEEPDPEEAW